MGKRANNQHATKSAKKTKLEPALACVADVIKQSEQLPEACRAMLVDMLPFSLSIPSDERHETQTWAVQAVEQTLHANKAALEAASAAEDEKLASLKSSEGELGASVAAADAASEAQKVVVQSAESAHAERMEAANVASQALAALQEQQKTCETNLASTKEEKDALEPAYQTHFAAPMQGGAGPHFKELQPFLKKIDMEASLLKAIPSVCSKSKEDRGSFDDVVLQELGKALTSKLTALSDAIAAETSASVERATDLQAGESDTNAKKEAQQQAHDVLTAAMKEQSDREAALTAAKQAVENFQPQVDTMTKMVEKARAAAAKFESGPLASFITYKTRVAVEPPAEAAPAGA